MGNRESEREIKAKFVRRGRDGVDEGWKNKGRVREAKGGETRDLIIGR